MEQQYIAIVAGGNDHWAWSGAITFLQYGLGARPG